MRVASSAFPWPLAIAPWDGIAILVVILLAVRGASKGLVGGAVRTAGFVSAILLASVLDRPMGGLLQRLGWVSHESAPAVGWAVVVGLVVIGSTLLASLLRAVVHETPLRPLDRVGGAAFGALVGVGLVAVAVLTWAGARPREEVRAVLRGSATVAVVDAGIRVAGRFVPQALRERWVAATGAPPP